MNSLVNQISSYKLFNYLLTGATFVLLALKLNLYFAIQYDIVSNLFLYIFVGVVMGSIRTIFIKPLLEKIGFLKFSKYTEFLCAIKNDKQIEVLSEENNMKGAFCAVFAVLSIWKALVLVGISHFSIDDIVILLLLIVLLIIFLLSYRKQSQYISDRIVYAIG